MGSEIRRLFIEQEEEKMKNLNMPAIQTDELNGNIVLEFKSANDLVWHEIIMSELNKSIDKDKCRCGAVGCKYKNQLLHR